MKQSKNLNSSSNLNNFVDCRESIKIEDIKEEINEEEYSDDILTEVKEEVTDDFEEGIKFKDTKKEIQIKEEKNAEDLLHIQGDTAKDEINPFLTELKGKLF
jgi:hypothetical protein